MLRLAVGDRWQRFLRPADFPPLRQLYDVALARQRRDKVCRTCGLPVADSLDHLWGVGRATSKMRRLRRFEPDGHGVKRLPPPAPSCHVWAMPLKRRYNVERLCRPILCAGRARQTPADFFAACLSLCVALWRVCYSGRLSFRDCLGLASLPELSVFCYTAVKGIS